VDELQKSENSNALAVIADEVDLPPMRASVIEVDMLMYAAIVGRVPQIVPVVNEFMAPPSLPRPQLPAEPTWSPIILNIHLRSTYRQNPLMLATPEIAA
jgi:hypothetical protein